MNMSEILVSGDANFESQRRYREQDEEGGYLRSLLDMPTIKKDLASCLVGLFHVENERLVSTQSARLAQSKTQWFLAA